MPSFDTPQPISVILECGLGDVRVVATDRADTVVDIQPSDPAKPADVSAAHRTTVDFTNGVLSIKAPKGWRSFGPRRDGESVEVRIELPTGSRLRGEAGLAALRCIGALGDCHYKTGGGDLSVEHVGGRAELTTGTGAVRADRIDGSAVVRNGNGDTWIGEAGGDLQVKTANGKIAVDHARAGVAARTANGNIHLDEVAHGVIVAETGCGTVDVAVRSGVAAWLDLHTGFGKVTNLLDTGAQPAPSEDTVQVRARSSFGDISIRRADIGDIAGAAGDAEAARGAA